MKRLASALLLSAAFASFAEASDLMDIYSQALTSDSALASAKAAYQAGQEKLPQGRALLLPSVNLSANSTWNKTDIQYRGPSSFAGGQRDYNSNGATLSLSQPIYRPQNWALYQEGKLQSAQAEIQYTTAQQDLILRVAQAYFDALLAQDAVALAKAQLQSISEQLAQAKMNFEVGTATITDTHEAQARYDLGTASEIAALNSLELKQRALERIIGKLPQSLAVLATSMPLQGPEPADMTKWVEAAEQNNLQVQIQRAAVEIANQEVARNRGGHHPTLDLVASYSDTGATGSSFGVGNDTKASAIGLQLNLPLYQGGAISSRVREAVANQEKARQDLEQTVRQTALTTREAYFGVTSGISQVKALEQALVSSQSSLDSTKLGLEVGVRTNVDVLNAQQQLYSTKSELYKARYNYLLSRLRLKSAAGTLAEDDLQQVNRWLK
ncbi:outer membrane protein [Sulfurimicrobium lacus]|uniref:Outer membrane protein n=1 Tax=Sulfurimicrobium lacus TaxID=2715678 RepID=A0A6F8V883_9PROT|nr:TolC family outer membrane protein [Sulfurimicrobium lacus]BCB25341.1 outer membrane protein [Sulfurimicrobium lacus]